MSTHVEYIKTVERIEKKKCQGGPITERLNFKINTEFKILGLKSKNEEEKNIRVKNFKMLTHVEYIKTVETMKTKMSRGEPITEKQHLKINTQYFFELKSTFFELKSMREKWTLIREIRLWL